MSWKDLPKKLTIDQIAEMFNLPPWEKIDDLNLDNYLECAESAIADFEGTEEDREEEYYRAQDAASDRFFHAWHNAISQAAEKEFAEHEIILIPRKVQGKVPEYPYEYWIRPSKTWKRSADLIRETINGVGYFHYTTLSEFVLSGPYTHREAVLSHLHWISRRAEVYGDTSARARYESSIESFNF